MAQIGVNINGRNYRMACDDGQEEHLTGLAEKFDGYIANLKGSFGEIGDMRLTVMAGIMVTDELVGLQQRIRGLEAEIESLRESRTAAFDSVEVNRRDMVEAVENAAGRIEALAGALNKSVHEQ